MSNDVRKTTTRIINELWNGGNPNKAVLAGLRNSQTINSRQAVVVWPLMFESMDEHALSHNGQLTREERTIFTALRCFAVYQQGHDSLLAASSRENGNGEQLMVALSRLRQDDRTRNSIDRRVQAMLVTNNIDVVINSLSHLTPILKGQSGTQPLDFADLAQDLYNYQSHFGTSNGARRVALKWGQQYFWINAQNQNKSKEK